ncbi:restriction endonuclease subunit S [Hyphobacterium sp. CCMP332]|nr:restriction endonuclease subunit S [Hyphobacterium sp. CCMP332]
MEEFIEYSEHWESQPLESILMYVIGGDWGKEANFSDEDFTKVYVIRGSEFRDWSRDKGSTASLRCIKNSSLDSRKLELGDILLEISGGGPDQPVGRTVLIDKQALSFEPEVPKVCTNFLRLLRFPTSLDKKFLNFYFTFFYNSGEVTKYQGGSNNLRNLKFKEFSRIQFPIPPLNEQHRIVAKIEELFSELDNGVENLKLAQNQLKVYRQALLKHAFEGKLTEEWRKKNNPEPADKLLERIKAERQARYEQELKDWKVTVKNWEKEGKKGVKPRKPTKPSEFPELKKEDLEKFPLIPDSWSWVRNNELLYYVTSGSRDWKKYYSDYGSYFIRTQDIKTNKLELEDAAFVDLPEKVEGKKKPSSKGDLLMTITGANVGKVAIIDQEIPEAYVSQSVALMKPVDTEITPYLHNYFQSNSFGAKMINELVYGVGRPVLSLENMREAAVAIPSLEEQKVIVSEIESQVSIIEKLEEEVSAGITKTEALRQSILKKAFEGKLVDQDSNDEPAYELLMRIQEEKKKYLEELKKQRKKTPKRTKKMSKKLSVEDVLKAAKKPMSAKEVWQQSKHKGNIDEFYFELKKIQEKIKEVKRGNESLLSIIDED